MTGQEPTRDDTPAAVPSGSEARRAALRTAAQHLAAGDLDAARRQYLEILEAEPDQADARAGLGVLALQAGRNADAAAELERLVAAHPGHAGGWNLLGLARARLGRPDAAEAAFRRALELNPRFPEAWANLGAACQDQGRLEEAETALGTAVELSPALVFAQNNLGMVRMARARPGPAAAAYRAALTLAPDNPVLHNNLGNALGALGDLPGAVAAFRRAVALNGGYFEANLNLGNVLLDFGRREEAAEAYRQAVAIRPDLGEGHLNLGTALFYLKRPAEAAPVLRRALELRPDDGAALSCLVLVERQNAHWEDLAVLEADLRARVDRDRGGLDPMAFLAMDSSPAEQLAVARAHARRLTARYAEPDASPPPRIPMDPHRRLTVGYLSPDFGDHPVGRLAAAVFEAHDRSAFRVLAYALTPDDGSPLRARLERPFDGFSELFAVPAREVARRIRADGVDVLVDLGGYTAGTRAGILALRPAPVQVSYLGYPGTMGAPFVDYIVADRFVLPPEDQPHYTERPAYLPGCFLPMEPAETLPVPPDRAACGLPERGFVFCAFNRVEKIRPGMFECWMGLLRDVTDSVLWLSGAAPTAEANLRREAERRGVAAERLRFAPRVPGIRDHLARLRHAGLFLDTLPYNAHATAADALRAGVPVLTCPGRSFCGRVAGSLLTALGLGELVAPDLDAYARTAVHLATHPDALAALRVRLEPGPDGPRLDPVALARHLEAAYRRMAERQAAGEAPAPLDVPA